MRVGTTWWVGPSQGRGCYPYTETHAKALRSQVEAAGHELTVLGNRPGADRELRERRLWGWWAKLEWFAPWNRDLRPALVMDLDTFVFRLDEILALDPTRLWMIRQFYQKNPLGESGLFIAPKNCDHVWSEVERLRRLRGGDGDFLRQFPHAFIPDEVPGILSYKVHELEGRRPGDARIVCFHGRPKPWDLPPETWAGKFWREHAGLA